MPLDFLENSPLLFVHLICVSKKPSPKQYPQKTVEFIEACGYHHGLERPLAGSSLDKPTSGVSSVCRCYCGGGGGGRRGGGGGGGVGVKAPFASPTVLPDGKSCFEISNRLITNPKAKTSASIPESF